MKKQHVLIGWSSSTLFVTWGKWPEVGTEKEEEGKEEKDEEEEKEEERDD